MIRDFTGEERGLRAGCGDIVRQRGRAKWMPRAKCALPMVRAKLRRHASEDAGQDVPAAPFGHAGISSGIHKGSSIGCGENCMKSFKDHVGVPGFCGFQCNAKAIGLHFVIRKGRRGGPSSPGCGVTASAEIFSLGDFLGAAGEGV